MAPPQIEHFLKVRDYMFNRNDAKRGRVKVEQPQSTTNRTTSGGDHDEVVLLEKACELRKV